MSSTKLHGIVRGLTWSWDWCRRAAKFGSCSRRIRNFSWLWRSTNRLLSSLWASTVSRWPSCWWWTSWIKRLQHALNRIRCVEVVVVLWFMLITCGLHIVTIHLKDTYSIVKVACWRWLAPSVKIYFGW